ncbi:MAG: N-acetylmuramoyl-L-alanine amidase [Eubacterium sp.]|nr:N-acetylmuramoyl-L-alanine amidase [Eubacterium sp.]
MAIKIYIDQGHNPYNINAGAEGNGLREQDITYLVGMYLYDLLSANPNFEALTSRKYPAEILGYDNNSSLRARVDEANTWGADYFISIHTNANVNPAINGTEAYVYSTTGESYVLATYLVDSITTRLGTKNNGIYARPSLYVLRRTNMPAVLVELAYITNYEDALLLANNTYDFSYAMYEALLVYFGLD